MNTNELEDAIRAELRAEVRQAPAGAPTKAAVLQAIRELPAPEQNVRHLKRWTVPLLAAAAVVLVAVGLTVGARALTSSRPGRPTQPINQQRITPPPPDQEDCSANGQTLVNGAQTSFLDAASGQLRYVFEYYCAGTDGARTESLLQVFRQVAGNFEVQGEVRNPNTIVLVLTGARDGFRTVEAVGFTGGGTSPEVLDTTYHEPFNGQPGNSTELAPGCQRADLTVRLETAQLPTPHRVLQLINHSARSCAVWGNPRYTPLNAAGQVSSQPVNYLLRGPAGGVTTAPSAGVLILQPGQLAAASIGTPAPAGCIPTTQLGIVLQGEVDLGTQPFSACGIDSYPLVARAAGDDAADYPAVPQQSAPSPCGGGNQLQMSSHPASTQSGDGAGLALTVKLLAGESCTLSGYPDVHAVGRADAVLATAGHTPRGILGGLAAGTDTPPTVTLKAGQTASVLAEWAAAAYTPTSQCVRNVRISLTFGATSSIPNPSIGQVCDLTVHPWVDGTTGSQ